MDKALSRKIVIRSFLALGVVEQGEALSLITPRDRHFAAFLSDALTWLYNEANCRPYLVIDLNIHELRYDHDVVTIFS